MKKPHIFLLASLVWVAAWAEDDNSFYFTDAALMPGEATPIELCMKNSAADLTCLEAEIQLPEGLSIVCDEEGNPVVSLYRNRLAGHELMANVLDSGNLKLLISSIDGKLIGGSEGPLMSFLVQAAISAPKGESTLKTVGESLLVNTDAEAYYSVGATGNVLITDDATSIQDSGLGIQLSEDIYDLGGRKVVNRKSSNNKLPQGIYIRGGRKGLHLSR